MTYRNYINLNIEDLDKPIYRIFPVSRFIQVLTTKELTLVKPSKWDDPFENLLLSSEIKVGTTTADIAARNSVYGQCWTLHRETDAMWRIYSPNKDGVRVRSTPRKLLDALKGDCGDYSELRCFIGKVRYLTLKSLKKKLQSVNIFDANGSGIAESLLYKRKEFSHEKEIRLVFSGEDHKCTSDIFGFKIDPSQTLDRVLFDPRMSEDLRKSYITAIKALGYTAEIKRSTLYDPPARLSFQL
ncbi:DUF2971 domain-containing protein [Cohaesibacter haloalkalitolerans]|uniref:DUF2971 domain-containing protein n=1 Tax=Cohaesibacter haloalkalitolerans TaxID=1162980 RepID=UPI000E6588BA|nr:DUF2971 domain-containing protein [Cohaesibacter haloalkalitolerans]